AALLWFAPGRPVDGFWLALFILLQLTRLWVLATPVLLWSTRIVMLPGAPLVTGVPYRFVKHPNYEVVAGEIAALPLAFGLWPIAALFTLLHAAALGISIREEERSLPSLPA